MTDSAKTTHWSRPPRYSPEPGDTIEDRLSALEAERAWMRATVRAALKMPLPPGNYSHPAGVMLLPLAAVAMIAEVAGE